jgi:phenylpropionate dioxygenase-like ring-hydroxylating dioxygenase large terminal subunit
MGAWHYACSARRVSEPGTFFTAEAGRIPIVVTRARDGELRALLNVCRHRGHLVASGCGRRATLQCPYHAWTYELDGSLRRAPRSEREPGFDTTGLSLLPLAVATWGPFVFVNPDRNAAPFGRLDGVRTLARSLPRRLRRH